VNKKIIITKDVVVDEYVIGLQGVYESTTILSSVTMIPIRSTTPQHNAPNHVV